MENLRKVQVYKTSKHIPNNREYVGYFHAFSTQGDKEDVEPVAIIEQEDGTVKVEYAGYIKFLDRE